VTECPTPTPAAIQPRGVGNNTTATNYKQWQSLLTLKTQPQQVCQVHLGQLRKLFWPKCDNHWVTDHSTEADSSTARVHGAHKSVIIITLACTTYTVPPVINSLRSSQLWAMMRDASRTASVSVTLMSIVITINDKPCIHVQTLPSSLCLWSS